MRLFLLVCLLFGTSAVIAEDMSSMLVIIDMQKEFTTSKSSVVHVKNLIKDYRASERPILFVTVPGYGDLYDELTDASKDYAYKFVIEKETTDGSQNIMNFFQKTKMSPDFITIVGLNTCFCVYETVVGLNEKLPLDSSVQILVDPQGCHCHGHTDLCPTPYGSMKKYYSCIWKEQKYQEMCHLSHVKVKSFQDAPKRNQTKQKMRLKKLVMEPDLYNYLKKIEEQLKHSSKSLNDNGFLNILSPFLKSFNHE